MQKAISLTCAALVALCASSCTRIGEEKAWMNPYDPNGANYYPPEISAALDTTVAINDSVAIVVTGSDANGSIAKYRWSFDGGDTWSHESPGDEPFWWSWDKHAVGKHVLCVQAVDNDGLASPADSVFVQVRSYAPTVKAVGNIITSQTQTVTVSLEGSDTNGTISAYYWATGGGNWDDSTTGSTISLSAPDGGNVDVVWAARDHDDLFAYDTFSVLFNRKPEGVSVASPLNAGSIKYQAYNFVDAVGQIALEFEGNDPDGADDTLTYTLQLGPSAAEFEKVYRGTKPRAILGSIKPASTYFWRVTAKDLYGDSAVGSGSFKSPPPPPAPAGMSLVDARNRTFAMGNIASTSGELQTHNVALNHHFWIDSAEVTRDDFYRLFGLTDTSSNGRLPVANVSWYDAVLYCNVKSIKDGLDTVYTYTGLSGAVGRSLVLADVKADFSVYGYRLPTEAEWEFAARAGSKVSYYWGGDKNKISDNAWYEGNSNGQAHAVMQKGANAFGLYDALGNVWEWCNDWYDQNYYASSPATNPTGPASGTAKVSRGGSYFNDASYINCFSRIGTPPDTRGPAIGFRTVLQHP
ncbi:MAG: SUMF1/EgtB/PvdO family nonheme iron enzyme [Chitinivibrionales bacterium]|nr:SUMF1/EgtB/PvdO family nonheme iron enzyme [Chitinivibrionales bacterium]